MREVDRAGLVAASRDPFVHHHLDLAHVHRAWVDGPAAVVAHSVGWSDAPTDAEALLCLGPRAELDALIGAVAPSAPRPWRVVVEAASLPALPAAWEPTRPRRWHWMTTRSAPARSTARPGVTVAEVPPEEVDAVLDEANPGSFARSGTPGLERWLGVRADDGRLVAVGALLRQHDGTGHLRGIATLAAHRGRGLGEAVTAALTTRALAAGPGLATLGVYTDNDVAVGLYRRLGYEVVHTFVAGVTAV
ncbi:GNAT family N-acetyltransferase [Nocardioides rubriscoriae]|uniref:GNAT family N-acetyltransferase n=1 Tax=Nocardioides rubriscoriae TaxID=642762 RepID=UPI001B87A54B|nr:GNAT family N-acetyltransferase [Nocardioides rubriscoriae]